VHRPPCVFSRYRAAAIVDAFNSVAACVRLIWSACPLQSPAARTLATRWRTTSSAVSLARAASRTPVTFRTTRPVKPSVRSASDASTPRPASAAPSAVPANRSYRRPHSFTATGRTRRSTMPRHTLVRPSPAAVSPCWAAATVRKSRTASSKAGASSPATRSRSASVHASMPALTSFTAELHERLVQIAHLVPFPGRQQGAHVRVDRGVQARLVRGGLVELAVRPGEHRVELGGLDRQVQVDFVALHPLELDPL